MHAPDIPTWRCQAVDTKEYAIVEKKICTSCKTEKPVSEFHRFGSGGTQVGKWCEACYTKKIAGEPTASPKRSSSTPN